MNADRVSFPLTGATAGTNPDPCGVPWRFVFSFRIRIMKIVDVRITGLSGGTIDGGWPQGNKPEEDLNTLVEVITDEGLIGVGSAMTSKSLIVAAVALLRPHLIGERADEPARVTEKLRQSTFWQGRGGAVEPAISGIDLALWG